MPALLEPADIKRLRSLEVENSKLKRRLAERDLEVANERAAHLSGVMFNLTPN